MQLADAIFRSGHLSDRVLADVCMTGDRPAHLDRCDICAARAVELGRWLDDVRAAGFEEADAAFPPERLAAQQTQILRRLEQMDRPARVIAFPAASTYDRLALGGRGVRPAWVAIAAAAGLVLGMVGGQFSPRFAAQRGAAPTRPAVVQQPAPAGSTAVAQTAAAEISDLDEFDHPQFDAVEALDAYTPHSIARSQEVVLRTNRLVR